MKIVRQGKVYDYDYKSIVIHGKHYRELSRVAKQNKLPLGKMIIKLVEHYENSIR